MEETNPEEQATLGAEIAFGSVIGRTTSRKVKRS